MQNSLHTLAKDEREMIMMTNVEKEPKEPDKERLYFEATTEKINASSHNSTESDKGTDSKAVDTVARTWNNLKRGISYEVEKARKDFGKLAESLNAMADLTHGLSPRDSPRTGKPVNADFSDGDEIIEDDDDQLPQPSFAAKDDSVDQLKRNMAPYHETNNANSSRHQTNAIKGQSPVLMEKDTVLRVPRDSRGGHGSPLAFQKYRNSDTKSLQEGNVSPITDAKSVEKEETDKVKDSPLIQAVVFANTRRRQSDSNVPEKPFH
jgi:hypothetical protein